MRGPVHFIPILTTFVAIAFAVALWRRWRERKTGPHLLWWAFGALTYSMGTFTEASVSLWGWSEPMFRAWYITGALLGGAPLAQGTVYLLLTRRTANRLTAVLVPFIIVAAAWVLAAPIDHALVEPHRLTGRVFAWPWVRAFSPLINLYALVFLAGGAALSAWRYRFRADSSDRAIGNALIALGALLPGIGGAFTRFGYTEVLYVTELVGLILMIAGYRFNIKTVSGASYANPLPAPAR